MLKASPFLIQEYFKINRKTTLRQEIEEYVTKYFSQYIMENYEEELIEALSHVKLRY